MLRCPALMQGAARHLAAGGRLITYGPYFERDVPSAPSDLVFDSSLRERDATWGIRYLHDVGPKPNSPVFACPADLKCRPIIYCWCSNARPRRHTARKAWCGATGLAHTKLSAVPAAGKPATMAGARTMKSGPSGHP